MSQPLLRVVCLYAFGVVLAGSQDPGLLVWAVSAIAGVLLAVVFPRHRAAVVGLVLISTGGANLSLRNHVWSPHDLRVVAPGEPALASLRGRLVEAPRLTRQVRQGKTHERTLGEIRMAEVRFQRTDWVTSSGRIAVTSSGQLPAGFHQGSEVEVDGVLARPSSASAPGLFDYAHYLEKKGIHYQLRAEGPADWRLVPPGQSANPPLTERFVRWARGTLAAGLPQDDPATGLIQAMTLGWKTALTDEVEEPFMKSGTMHVFAISGLHVFMLAGIFLSALKMVRVPHHICSGVVIPVLWFYSAATGWQPSAVRATVMMTILLAGWSLRRPTNLLNSMAGAALIILMVDPRQLFQASFQFSFAVVLSLGIILPPLQTRARRALEPDPMLPRDRIPLWRRWLGHPLSWVVLTFMTSIAAWLGSMPLSAHYFHLFTPGTLCANLLLLPCAGAALASAVASLATGAWFPWLSEVFNHGAWFWMRCMMTISEQVAAVPGAYRYVASPSTPLTLLYYGTLLALATGWVPRRWVKYTVPSSCLLMAVLLALSIWSRLNSAVITLLPVNGGMSIHVKTPGTFRADLVDCGDSRAYEAVVRRFLQARGEHRLNSFFLTHGDARHVGGGASLIEDFEPDEVGIGSVRFRSSTYRQVVQEIQASGMEPRQLSAGNISGQWEVLHPPSGYDSRKADDAVLVLRTVIHGKSILLVSDLDRRGQRRLLDGQSATRLDSDILVVGLSGERHPMASELLERVDPALVVVCDSEWPAGRRATPELLDRYREQADVVLTTRDAGSIRLEFFRGRWNAVDGSGELLAQPAETAGVSE